MHSVTTIRFRLAYAKLPKRIQDATKQACKQWLKGKAYSGLHIKLLRNNIYSTGISMQYRALAVKQADTYIWYWIGAHADCDQLLQSFK